MNYNELPVNYVEMPAIEIDLDAIFGKGSDDVLVTEVIYEDVPTGGNCAIVVDGTTMMEGLLPLAAEWAVSDWQKAYPNADVQIVKQ